MTQQELPVPPNLSGSWLLMHRDGRRSSPPFWRVTEDMTSSQPLRLHISAASESREAIQAAPHSQHFSAGPCAWEEEAVLVSRHPAWLRAIARSHCHHLPPTQASYTSDLDLDAVWAQTHLPSTAGKGKGKARVNGGTKPLSAVSNVEAGRSWASRVHGNTLQGLFLGLWTSRITHSSRLGQMSPPNLEHGSAVGQRFIQKNCLWVTWTKLRQIKLEVPAVWSEGQLTLVQNIGEWFATKARGATYTCDGVEWISPADACMTDDWRAWIRWYYYYYSSIFTRKISTEQYLHCTGHKHSFNQH